MLNALKKRSEVKEVEKGAKNVVTPRYKGDVHVKESRPEEISEGSDNLGGDVQVNPSVKDTFGEDNYKTAKSHSSVEPTVADILTKLKGKRVKRVLRKQGAPVKFVREKVPSPVKKDDDIIIVSSTASRRKTRSSDAALKKKKAALGLGGDPDEFMEHSTSVDLQEFERKAEERKRSRKGKKASEVKESGSVAKRRKGVDWKDTDCLAYKGTITGFTSEFEVCNSSQGFHCQPMPTLNITNVSEALGRMLYVMGTEHVLNVGKIIFDQIVDHVKTGAKLKPIGLPSLICSLLITQHPTVLKKEDGIGEDAKPLTISDKLMKGKHVLDVEFNATDQSKPIPEGEATGMLLKVYEEELLRIESKIQAKTVLASELKAKIYTLKSRVPPTVNASVDHLVHVATTYANPPAGDETSTSPV
ncbi:hypothetical protein LIER_28256 [Lithospermum erythrorhizon]|uniref:Uncharacterized protein n=1 Tax=Lithospermum erythrorhizon TaxID=34254 RepID=A0AAV3RF17_LITER